MTALTIEITDDRMEQLKEKAAKLGITPEELVRAGIEELLMQSDMSLKAAIDHVLTKNTELYRRLS
ncbi:MAG TPA: ribbon-helix-helix protein, CopG family [Roseiflexaceae bacterium]|nr:ribbon-helix-helix protein, CopG family [Roseiflexaceae bacterium]HMP39781.1 ribbon-helix-helix protein, CopG family [Roseiflexaceae bacterium]